MKSKEVFKKNRAFYIGMIGTVCEGLLSGSIFMLLYYVMEALQSNHFQYQEALKLTALLAVIFLLRLVIYGFSYTQSQIGGAAVSKDMRLLMGDKIKKIPLSRFTKRQTGDYINALTSDVNNYEKILTHKAGDLVKNITLSVMLIIFTATIYLPAGVILLGTDLLLIPGLWLSFRMVRKYGAEKNIICGENVSSIVEYVSGIQTFRAYGIGGSKNKTVTKAMKDFCDISFVYEAKVLPIGAALSILIWLASPLLIWLGYKPYLTGELSGTSYLLICMLPLFCAKLANTIFVDSTGYKNLLISKAKIMNIVNEPEESGSVQAFTPVAYDITFQEVGFAYDPKEPILEQLSFTAQNGKLTAIIGDSGSGKSTIMNLIAKYYVPSSGKILIDGVDIAQLACERVLQQISMVDQDVFLFDATIRENIRYARPDATDDEVDAACQAANCTSFIQKTKQGYDTPIGENGNLLSGGERQRLSIARAILKDSPILLLDEATASLDIENELAVKEAITHLLEKDKTVLMIAHTLAIVRHADLILVVADKTIKEAGTHEELLEKDGKYAALWHAEQKMLT